MYLLFMNEFAIFSSVCTFRSVVNQNNFGSILSFFILVVFVNCSFVFVCICLFVCLFVSFRLVFVCLFVVVVVVFFFCCCCCKIQLERAVDGAPSQILTFKFLDSPNTPSPTRGITLVTE